MSEETMNDPSLQYSRWLSSPEPGDEVVISGMSGRLPASNTIEEFKNNLHAKKEMITENNKHWMISHPEVPPRTSKLAELKKYDAGYFGVHYKQASLMDPMMRILMEVVVETIMDSGFNPSELQGTNTGVFFSTTISESQCVMFNDGIEEKNNLVGTGSFRSFHSHRLSYYLKLKGPAFNIDTACSSSLNAFESAFKAIRAGECDNALVAGTNLLLHPGGTIQFFRLGVLSPDAVCRPFDQEANGYVRGEAVVCVFLQKAKNARRIYAQVINVGVNDDGFKPEGITFPSMEAQKTLMTELYETSGVDPSDVSFMEAHATGTSVGDPQEVEAIDCAIAKKRTKQLLVGSVKCSIGHTEPASGVCSIIKVLLAMETGLIPPNINLNQIKDGLTGILEGRIKIVTELTKLKPDDAIVGINNFGFGGNNAHLIVRRFQKNKINGGKPVDDIPRLVCVSGRTKEAVLTLLNNLDKPLDGEYVGLVHQIFKRNCENHFYRGYIILSKYGLVKKSIHFSHQQSSLYVVFGSFVNNFNILATYFQKFACLREIMSKIAQILGKKTKTLENLFNKSTKSQDKILGSICVQLALVDIFKLLEIYPTAVYSDSYSKLVSAYYYNVISLEEALTTAVKFSEFADDSDFQFQIKLKNSSKDLFSSCLTFATLTHIPKDAFILNVSDSQISNLDVPLIENKTVKFLDILGRLYERGQSVQCHKLYPEIQFPVSRSTSMVSPFVRWDHRENWYTFQFSGFTQVENEQKFFYISSFDEDYKYTSGHVIDGRNLFPATGYLYLVWLTFARSRRLLPCDTPVIFRNCKFIRGVTLPKGGHLHILVSIQRGTNYFEIMERDSIVVNGFIEYCANVSQHQTNFGPLPFDKKKRTAVLEHDEIYREFYLRGYNYSGLFKGIKKCNVDASSGLITWENNWTSFMDKMLQMAILHADTRLLFVPIGIQKITIDPAKHLQLAEKLAGDETLFPVHVYKDCDVIKSGGIEITGLQARSISKQKLPLEPVIEKTVFVPNYSFLELSNAVRANTQIILEINLQTQFKAVEITDETMQPNSEFLLPFICSALDDVPIIMPDLTISCKTPMEQIPGVKVEKISLTSDSNLTLLVGAKILSRLSSLKPLISSISKNGFLLTREDIDFEPEFIKDFRILTEYKTTNEKLILLHKKQNVKYSSFVEVSSSTYDWLPKLKNSLKCNSSVVIFAHNAKTEAEGILGLVNCIRQEPKGNKVNCFFMMDDSPEFNPDHPFYSKQLKKGFPVNVYKNGTWGTYRHFRLEKTNKIESKYYYANVASRGDISSFKWLEASLNEQSPLEKNGILVFPYYSSVNFKDVVAASGRVSVEVFLNERLDQECPLGFEYSGRDVRGRRIMGIACTKAFASHILLKSDFLWDVPDCWSLEEAATIPVVYTTVIYALTMVTKLKQNTTILIHSGTGGVGLAALNVCLYHKCKIFVTVGTYEKRDYLKKYYPQIPESHIGNSRDTSFEEMIKIQTNGRGVDIVLNSLSEDKLKASVRCLARGGSFLEIGKFDLANDTSLELLFIEKEASYHGVMLDYVLLNSTRNHFNILNAVKKGIKLGYVKPLPSKVFEKDEIEASFRYMMTGKHVGKVLIKIREEESTKIVVPKSIPFKVYPRFNCDQRYTYIIIGGLGGIGLELADWLILRGAKKLVLVSRTGIQSGYQMQRIRIWKSYGVQVYISTNDVTTKQGCVDLISLGNKLGLIEAIFNLAVVLKDALFEDQTIETFLAAQVPKAQTTVFLDEITRKLCPKLKFFVVFSSVACGRGNAGQSNYGMANSVMERICEKRKNDGFSALAIQWGAIGDVGLVAKMQEENKQLVIGGTLQQKISSCFQVLDTLLKQPHPIVSCMVVAEKHKKNYGEMSAVEAVALVLGIKHKTVSQHAPLAELGMDSMTGTVMIQLLEKDYNIYITPKDIRTLTFAKLEEMEAERKRDKENNTTKTQLTTNMFIQFIPESSTSHSPYVRLTSQLQESEKGPTVIVLPGIEGVLKSYKSFVHGLKAHVFGINYISDNPEETVQETADSVLKHIQEILPKKSPFFIISYSYGVNVGLEVVTKLEKLEHTGQIICIEGSPSYLKSAAKSNFSVQTEAELQTLFLLHLIKLVQPQEIATKFKDKMLQCATLDDRIDLGSTLIPPELRIKQKLEKQVAITLYKRLKAVMNYEFTHEKIKAQPHLLKAENSMCSEENDYQLSKHFQQPLNVTTLNGDHATIINQPELVNYVNKVIDML